MSGSRYADAARIAADFAEIPFEKHEARRLALAYLELQEANQWLRGDVAIKVETIAALEAEIAQLKQTLAAYERAYQEAAAAVAGTEGEAT